MPVCFQLIRKADLKAGPVVLQQVDAEICQYLGVGCDPVHWCSGWYDLIGLMLALGKSFEQIDEWIKEKREDDAERRDRLLAINAFLRDNFTTNAWTEIGKR